MFLRNFGVGVDFGVICVRTFRADLFFLVTAGDANTASTTGATTGAVGVTGAAGAVGATGAPGVNCCGSCTFFSCSKYFLKAS